MTLKGARRLEMKATLESGSQQYKYKYCGILLMVAVNTLLHNV